jgi:hypothetical protein
MSALRLATLNMNGELSNEGSMHRRLWNDRRLRR